MDVKEKFLPSSENRDVWSPKLSSRSLPVLIVTSVSLVTFSVCVLVILKAYPRTPSRSLKERYCQTSDRHVKVISSSGPAASSTPTFVIACGQGESDAVEEMQPLLKSLLMFSSEPIRLIFLTDNQGALRLQELFTVRLMRAKKNLWVDIYVIRDIDIENWASKIQLDPFGHHSGRWGTSKLMVPWLLPDIKKAVVLDTDMVLLDDPIRLWNLFDDKKKEWAYKMQVIKENDPAEMCSCVVLIDLERARDNNVYPNVMHTALKTNIDWFDKHRNVSRPKYGDQGLYWLMMKTNPELFGLLPERWNVDKCHRYNNALGKSKSIKVSILHRNCFTSIHKFFGDSANTYFDFFEKYPWNWLQPYPEQACEIQVRNFSTKFKWR